MRLDDWDEATTRFHRWLWTFLVRPEEAVGKVFFDWWIIDGRFIRTASPNWRLPDDTGSLREHMEVMDATERLAFVLRSVRMQGPRLTDRARRYVRRHLFRTGLEAELDSRAPEEQEQILDEFAAKLPPLPRPSTRRLHHLLGSRNRAANYGQVKIPKRRGGVRVLDIPSRELRWVQRHLLQILSHLFPRHRAAHGFERGKSLVTHARQHVRKRWVYCIDIKDFFPSIHWGRIYGMFQGEPFECPPDVARQLANLVTHNGALPQGAPTSPILANLVCRRLDARLFKWAREHGFVYSRYADDLTFSTQRDEVTPEHQREIDRIVEEEGFTVHPDKRRLMPNWGRQIVTGLIVNQGLSVPREYIRHLRALLFNIETFGWQSQVDRKRVEHDGKMLSQRVDDEAAWGEILARQRKRKELIRPRMSSKSTSILALKRQVQGQVAFVGLVRGKTDGLYLHLKSKLGLLLARADREISVAAEIGKAKKAHRIEKVVLTAEEQPLADAVHALRALVKQTKASGITPHDLKLELHGLAEHILEVQWLLEERRTHEELLKRAGQLAFELGAHPQVTAAFFRSFRREDSFKGLTHDPDRFEAGLVHPADGPGPFTLTQLIGNAEEELSRSLPEKLRKEVEQFLHDWRRWVEVHPQGHPWLEEAFRTGVIMPFIARTRFDAVHSERNMIRQLQEAELARHATNAHGHTVALHLSDPDDLPTFYTYTPAIQSAVRSAINSMLEHTCTQDVFVDVRQHWEIPDIQRVEIRIHDEGGIIKKPPQLSALLSGNTRRILHALRGYASWMITAPFSSGESYQFDVMRNTRHPMEAPITGVEHRIIVPQ